MSTPEKRKDPRVKVFYPISYVCRDGKGSIVHQSTGMALNISQSGILIETANSVFFKHITLICVGLNKHNIEINGKVAYCKKKESEKYRVGIRFEDTYEQNINFVKEITRAYFYSKDKYHYDSVSNGKTAAI
jgi:hypothetical protein